MVHSTSTRGVVNFLGLIAILVFSSATAQQGGKTSLTSLKISSSNKSRVQESQSYRAFHRFGQTQIADSGLVLGSSQCSFLSQLPQKMTLASKVVKIDSKIIISLSYSKSVTQSVWEKYSLIILSSFTVLNFNLE